MYNIPTPSELLCKLVAVQQVGQIIDSSRLIIRQELIDNAGDEVKLKRRFRMLGQIGLLESQIYKKIQDFQGGTVQDYVLSIQRLKSEVAAVIDRSS